MTSPLLFVRGCFVGELFDELLAGQKGSLPGAFDQVFFVVKGYLLQVGDMLSVDG